MHDHPNKPDNPKDAGTDKIPDQNVEKAGFLMIRVRRGDEVHIGDSMVCFNEISMGHAKVGIKAPKATRITRKHK